MSNAVREDNKDDNKFPPSSSTRKVFFECENVFYNYHTSLTTTFEIVFEQNVIILRV